MNKFLTDAYSGWLRYPNFPLWEVVPLSPVARSSTFYFQPIIGPLDWLPLVKDHPSIPPYFSFSPPLYPHIQLLFILQCASICGSYPSSFLFQRKVLLQNGLGISSLPQSIYSRIQGLVGDLAPASLYFVPVKPQSFPIGIMYFPIAAKYLVFLLVTLFLLYVTL